MTERNAPAGLLHRRGGSTTTYTYDALGCRTTLALPGQQPLTYRYDPAGRLTALLETLAPPTGFFLAYDASGRRVQLTRPNGVTTAYTYDEASRVLRIEHQQAGAALEDLRYGYDPDEGRIRGRP